jgi:hypothetical protein
MNMNRNGGNKLSRLVVVVIIIMIMITGHDYFSAPRNIPTTAFATFSIPLPAG